MSGRRREVNDAGAAVVEFIGVSVVLLIPVTYLIITLSIIQAGSFAAESAARDAARSAVVTGVAAVESGATIAQATALARGTATDSVVLVAEDFGFEREDTSVEMLCSSTPCFQPGSAVSVHVTVVVTAPGVPSWITQIAPMSITVSSHARSPVDGLAS